MKEVILKIENVSKQYRLGVISASTLNDDVKRFLAKIRGKEDPLLKIGEVNTRSTKGTSDYVWSLKDISFDVHKGDVIGIIGKNGAGKSTLLKILSQVTAPTTGVIRSKGRIASLLEVGTGFHPELTGKENIFLNGAILGMTKKEIASKLEEIIEFSGTKRYIDTPVKRYSSGMRVRLAFAVAAHLDPDILIVDEVLAVGDAEFQSKAIGKMKNISEESGKTVLFVSHNMTAIKSLCSRCVVLNDGSVAFDGSVDEGLSFYQKNNNIIEHNVREWDINSANDGIVTSNISAKLLRAKLWKTDDLNNQILETQDSVSFEFSFEYFEDRPVQLDVSFHLFDETDILVFVGSSRQLEIDFIKSKGVITAKCQIPKNILNQGKYRVGRLLLVQNRGTVVLEINDILSFEVQTKVVGLGWQGKKEGVIRPLLNWSLNHEKI